MKKFLLYSLGVVLLLVIVGIGVLNHMFSPFEYARQQAIKMVSESNVLAQVDTFYWYRGRTQTYTLYGKNHHNESVYVIIDVASGLGSMHHDSDIIDQQAITQKVTQRYPQAKQNEPVIGMDNNVLIWEVTYTLNGQYNYMIFDAKTGSVLHEIKNATNE